MGVKDLEDCFELLVGKRRFVDALPKDFITAEEFASDVLGFEEYEEGEEDDDRKYIEIEIINGYIV